MREKRITLYAYSELSERAQEKAREWFREDYPYDEWWEWCYDDIAQRAEELGIGLKQKPVALMNGETRYGPEIYFSGFYHQGSGSSFGGTWRAWTMNPEKLRAEYPTETELHRICDVLRDCAIEDGEMVASITTRRDTSISVEVTNGRAIEEQLNELEYNSSEYNRLAQACVQRTEEVTEALRDFNHWIYDTLKKRVRMVDLG